MTTKETETTVVCETAPECCETFELPTRQPRVDIRETPDEFRLEVELPGVAKEGVELKFEGDRLRVEGVPAVLPDGNVRWRIREHGVARFVREFRLGETLDVEAIDASLTDGLLSVRLPKKGEARPRTIEIR